MRVSHSVDFRMSCAPTMPARAEIKYQDVLAQSIDLRRIWARRTCISADVVDVIGVHDACAAQAAPASGDSTLHHCIDPSAHGIWVCSAPMTWLNSKLHRKLRLNQDKCSGSSKIATSRFVCIMIMML